LLLLHHRITPKSIVMGKFNVTKMEAVFFKGTKKTTIGKVTRWPLLLVLSLIMIAGSAYTTARMGHPARRAKVKPVTGKPHSNALPLSPPTVSYSSPHTYQQGQTISLAPTSSGVATFGYATTGTPWGPAFAKPSGITTDAAGNVYVVDYSNGIIKIPPGNGTPVNIAPNGTGGLSIASDAAGNIFVSGIYYYAVPPDYDYFIGHSSVTELPVGGGTEKLLVDNDNTVYWVTADPRGDAFIGENDEYGDSDLQELPAGGSSLIYLSHDNGNTPYVDAAGNFFYIGYQNVYEFPAGNAPARTFAGNFPDLVGLAIDGSDNVFVVDQVTRQVTMIAAGSPSPTSVTIGPSFGYPSSIAVDGAGNVYVSSYTNSDESSGYVSQIKPTGGYFITPALPTGLSFDNNTGVISGTAIAASPATTYTITAYNANGSTSATVSIAISQGSSDADLAHLTATRGVLSPAFSTATTSYTSTVVNGVHSFQLTPITASPLASITINGVAVADSATTAALALAPGVNTFTVVVTAPDAVTTKTYSLTVNRAVSNNANLSSMMRSAGLISPVFTAATTSYTSTVTNGVRTLTVTPTASDPEATIKVNGTIVASGTASAPIPLPIGSTTINVTVTASDGTTTKTYSLTVSRPTASFDNLSALTLGAGSLSPGFASSTTAYTVTEANMLSAVTVTPTAVDPDATIKVNGKNVASGTASAAIAVPDGLSTISVVVTASDGVTSKTYTITVNRPASNNDNLSALTTSVGTLSPAFVAGTTIYTVTGINGTQLVTVTPTAADPEATIYVNGSVVASGTASAPISFAQGVKISIIVIASDGTAQTYILTGRETPNSNANLADIRLSNGNLSPTFTASTTSYTADGLNPVEGISIGADAADPGATVTLNGQSLPPHAGFRVPLTVGSNTAYIVVTASDGVTTKTYTLTIIQPASNVANLLALSISNTSLSPAFNTDTTSYTASVIHGVATVVVRPVTTAIASITVNGTAVPSGGASGSIPLNVGANVITVVVTAQDGVTQKAYTVTVTRAPSANANLLSLKFKAGVLNPVFAGTTYSYTANVVAGVSTDIVTPTTSDPGATVTINGMAVTSGTPSAAIPLMAGSNTITAVVTAQDGVTTNTYTVVITRAATPVNIPDESLSVSNPVGKPGFEDDVIIVHQGLSPNGDGINDFLVIDGIQAYPDNKLSVMNRNGQLVFETKGYDNASKVFDGHSNKNGQMQLPGTYFYSLEYTVNGVAKHKTGYLVLKY